MSMTEYDSDKRFGSSQPRVSIVTPSLNQGEFVEKTILSVLRQDYSNIEYIFVDALSTDQTVNVLKKYSKSIGKIIREKDSGQSYALNKGFEQATGEILAYLNADDCYASHDGISQVVSYFNTHQDADLIYGKRCSIDQSGFIAPFNQYPYRPFNKARIYKSDYIDQECTFWTKDIYKRAGGFINTDYQFAMDYELWLRFLEQDGSFHSVDSLYGLFRWHPNHKSQTMYKTTGLQEIARLHEKYLGAAVEFDEMTSLYEEHFSRINRNTYPAIANTYDQLWDLEVQLKQKILGAAPIDHWVYTRP